MEEKRVIEKIGYTEDEIVSLNDLLVYPEKYNITEISIGGDSMFNKEDNIVKLLATDIDHPFILKKDFLGEMVLYINEEYFLTHQSQVYNIVGGICKRTKEDKIIISDKILITDDIIDSIIENQNLKTVDLTPYQTQEENQYQLTKQTYEKFKKSNSITKINTLSIAPELQENFDPLIGYNAKRTLIEYDTYYDLQNEEELIISKELSDEEIENLKYIRQNKQIIITSNNYQNIQKILDKIIELSLTPQIEITVKDKDKEKFNQTEIFTSNKYDNLNITITNTKLSDYKRFENILYTFVAPIKNKNYSTFEKYIYVYNIAKKFKEYNASEGRAASRDVYEILFNEYMVCAGFANMFSELLNKVGIPNQTISLSVAVNRNGEDVEFGGHGRVYCYLKDPKYQIDGYYTADPTWDNFLTEDYYNYLALTSKEVTSDSRKIASNIKQQYSPISEYLSVDSIEEFYSKINYIINNDMNKYLNRCRNKKEVYNAKEKITEIYYRILTDLLEKIKSLNKEKYQEIITKYSIPELESQARKDESFYDTFTKIIEELGKHIVSKVNNPIPGQTIIDAAMVINKDVLNLTEEQEIEFRNHLIQVNKNRQSLAFPKRTIENATTGEITYENESNKFDIEDYSREITVKK